MTEEQGRSFSGFVNFWIHQVNLVRYLSGENYQVTHVTSDGLLLVAETDSGVSITLEMNTNQIKGQWMERFTVCFDKAEIELKLGAPMQRQHAGEVRVTTECATGPEDRLPFLPSAWAFEEQARNYVKTLKGELSLISPARHAALDLEIAEELHRFSSDFLSQGDEQNRHLLHHRQIFLLPIVGSVEFLFKLCHRFRSQFGSTGVGPAWQSRGTAILTDSVR